MESYANIRNDPKRNSLLIAPAIGSIKLMLSPYLAIQE
jgi:hypothetical protein